MSTPETQPETGRSSVTLTRNAKGDTQISVKLYADPDAGRGETDTANLAADLYDQLRQRYPIGGAS